jgi:hypothetical protein
MEYTELELEYVKKQKSIFVEIVENAVIEIKEEVRQLIKTRWLTGTSVNGGLIKNKQTGGGYASLKYKRLKILKNPIAGGNIDLTFTGALGDKIDITITQNGNYEIVSLDSKYNEIGNKYGFDEFGLTVKQKVLITNKLERLIFSKIENLYL